MFADDLVIIEHPGAAHFVTLFEATKNPRFRKKQGFQKLIL
jgi:hypothetical protein